MFGWNLGFGRGLLVATIAVFGFGLSAARAQTVIDAGKTAPQLFASDCSPCHKSPQGLAKGSIGLSGFLRQHYTASRENADALASYLSGAGDAKAAPAVRKREAKPATAAKPEDGKTGDAKTEAKPASAKSEDKPVSDSKPAESKPAESKPADAPVAKPAE